MPSTTCEFSDSPLNAATVRVVRLLAAAIDHSVSPGCTTCGTAAPAGAAREDGEQHGEQRSDGARRCLPARCLTPARLARQRRDWKRCARGYVTLHGILRCRGRDLKLWAAEVALVRAQLAARGTAPGSTTSSRARRASPAGRCTATCSRCCSTAASSSASTCCSSPTSGSPRRRRAGSASAAAVPQPRRPGRGRRAGRDRRALHVRQRLLRHRRQPPLRRPRQAGDLAGLHDQGPDARSATTSGAARTSSSPAA